MDQMPVADPAGRGSRDPLGSVKIARMIALLAPLVAHSAHLLYRHMKPQFRFPFPHADNSLSRDSDTLRRPKKSSSTGGIALKYFNLI